jgi:hypothetical protein
MHAVGYVIASDDEVELMYGDGRTTSLVLLDDAEPISKLDGWLVEIDGQRRADGGTRVRSWQAIEGPHGVTAWVGPVQTVGSGVGIYDRRSDALYVLDDASAVRLRGLPGALVAAEAWVVGPQALHVVELTILQP